MNLKKEIQKIVSEALIAEQNSLPQNEEYHAELSKLSICIARLKSIIKYQNSSWQTEQVKEVIKSLEQDLQTLRKYGNI